MADPDPSQSIPTEPWSGPGGSRGETPPGPGPAPTPASPRRSGWQAPEPEQLQASFPQYEIQGVLGRGGMGAVYKGWQKRLDRFVAIKILPPGLEDQGVNFAERFQREAKAMARFSHPGIVTVYDAGETPEGLLYFIMEYIEGTDVQQMVKALGPLAPQHALSITAHVCDALAYAHKRGVIHRDIKPSNIMVDREGQVKVADFGLAKVDTDDSGALVTGTHVRIGTPDFMAPEVLYGAGQVDHRADLYAVGVMLYQMLTGELPRGMFEMPSVHRPGVDPRFDTIVSRAMQKDPAKRYSNATEIRADLDEIVSTQIPHRSAVQASPAPPPSPKAAVREGSPAPPSRRTASSAARSRGPSRWVWLSSAIAATILMIVGGTVFFNDQPTSRVSEAAPPTAGVDPTQAEAPVPDHLPAPASAAPGSDARAAAAAAAAAPASAAVESGAIKLWNTPDKVPTRPEGTSWIASWKDEALFLDASGGVQYDEHPGRDVIFRALVRLNPDARATHLSVRWKVTAGKPSYYRLTVHANNKSVILDSVVEGEPQRLGTWQLPPASAAAEWTRLELRAIGPQITALADDVKLGDVKDQTNPGPGGVGLYASANGYFRDVVFLPLDKPAAATAAVDPSKPSPATATPGTPYENSLGMKFVPVIITGGPSDGQRVLFSVWETRVRDYEVFAKQADRPWLAPGFSQGPLYPAVNISWEDATAFCEWLTDRERKAGRLTAGEKYRLPTDHEWSCAAGIGREDPQRTPAQKDGGISDEFPWGKTWPPPTAAANVGGEELQSSPGEDGKPFKTWLRGYVDPFPRTAPVGSFAPNELGLHDLGGNAREWVQDVFKPTGMERTLRGGAWLSGDKKSLLSSCRSPNLPGGRSNVFGFRVVLAPAD